jgi:lysophospholipase L1-like esterase
MAAAAEMPSTTAGSAPPSDPRTQGSPPDGAAPPGSENPTPDGSSSGGASGVDPAPAESPGASEPAASSPDDSDPAASEPDDEPEGSVDEPTGPDDDGTSPDEGSEPPEDETPADQPGDDQPGDDQPGDDVPDNDVPDNDVPDNDDPDNGEPPADPPGDDRPDSTEPTPGEGTVAGQVGPGSPEIPGGLASFHLTVIGSSTAAGIGASRGDLAWSSLLDQALTDKVTTAFSSSNLAFGGYTAQDLLPGSGSPGSIDDAIAEKPDLIIIALAGSNDLGTPNIDAEVFVAELVSLREVARAAGIPTFFMGTLPKNFSEIERETLVDWDRAMASEFSLCWIPGTTKPYAPCYMDVFDSLSDTSLGLAPALDSGDGQHPNDAGHAVLFNRVAPIVTSYVCSKTTCK